ncbi:uncharacterized protein LOC106160646 [Lingula anatina]|uniref:Uncharacterized protein LOC106160646 n=1 Tax=Lingula anatina TaxID=7574 RepID=A0A1S3I4K4_LINAN|nr:uncharacterized protein LOC106160646 [Lingula anatina]|eukprot:XP_013393153.1 uncharacterized protein LOC106160646 [Lingula anatina]
MQLLYNDNIISISAMTYLYFTTHHIKDGKFSLLRIHRGHGKEIRPEDIDEVEFLSPFDKEIKRAMMHSINSPTGLLKVALPCAITMACCPLFLSLQPWLIYVLWTDLGVDVKSLNVNDAIRSFLTPSGLVYAIMFGFVFQSVALKQGEVRKRFLYQIGLLGELTAMTSKVHMSPDDKMEVYRSVKDECIQMTFQILNRPLSQFHHEPTIHTKESLYGILDRLRKVDVNDISAKVDVVLMNKAITIVVDLIGVDYDKLAGFRTRLHPLQWIILESLGLCAYLGILMVDGKSYRFELVIAMITVFSIAMLCYIVSDLDQPFAGFFKIDMLPLFNVINRSETAHKIAFYEAAKKADIPVETCAAEGTNMQVLDEK